MLQVIGAITRKAADVTHKLALRTLAQAVSPQFDATYRHNMAWTLAATVTPTGAGSYFFYIINNDDLRDMMITRVTADIATTDTIEIRHVTGTAGGTLTNLTPLCRTLASAPPFNATAQTSTGVTGLTNVGVLERMKLITTQSNQVATQDRPILLPRGRANNAVAFAAITGAIAINFQVDVMIQTVDPLEFNM